MSGEWNALTFRIQGLLAVEGLLNILHHVYMPRPLYQKIKPVCLCNIAVWKLCLEGLGGRPGDAE